MLLVVGSTRGEATYGGAGVVAFYFPSVRLCAGGSALRTPKTRVKGQKVCPESRIFTD